MSLLTLQLLQNRASSSSIVFFPGGPGLSWHCFEEMVDTLEVPSNIYGINYHDVSHNHSSYFEELKFELILLLQRLPNPVLVTHSFSSMLALTIPRLPSVKGLVLMNPAINNFYLTDLPQRIRNYTDFDGTAAAATFWMNPSDESYGDYYKALAPFYFRPEHLHKGLEVLDQCKFSYLPYALCVQHFYPSFTESHSLTIPTLVIAGGDDHICPPTLFQDSDILKGNHIRTHIIPNAGHFPWIDHSQETLNVFSQWYNRLNHFMN